MVLGLGCRRLVGGIGSLGGSNRRLVVGDVGSVVVAVGRIGIGHIVAGCTGFGRIETGCSPHRMELVVRDGIRLDLEDRMIDLHSCAVADPHSCSRAVLRSHLDADIHLAVGSLGCSNRSWLCECGDESVWSAVKVIAGLGLCVVVCESSEIGSVQVDV